MNDAYITKWILYFATTAAGGIAVLCLVGFAILLAVDRRARQAVKRWAGTARQRVKRWARTAGVRRAAMSALAFLCGLLLVVYNCAWVAIPMLALLFLTRYDAQLAERERKEKVGS
jgi:4-hydroxybenzoate polyprenyltransferase